MDKNKKGLASICLVLIMFFTRQQLLFYNLNKQCNPSLGLGFGTRQIKNIPSDGKNPAFGYCKLGYNHDVYANQEEEKQTKSAENI